MIGWETGTCYRNLFYVRYMGDILVLTHAHNQLRGAVCTLKMPVVAQASFWGDLQA